MVGGEIVKPKRMTQERHGMSKTRMYRQWSHMLWRCYNENCEKYMDYGGRGIIVNEDWKESFIAFYNDMSDGYKNNLELDRINVNGNYEVEDCRWVTRNINVANRRPPKTKLFPGVSKNHKCNTYRARISVENIRYTIGHYDTPEEAHDAYIIIYKEWYGVLPNV